MKNTKKISVLISLVLISILAIGAVSAAEDTALTDDADLAVVDDVQTVDDAPITDEIVDDAVGVISDAGLEGDSDDGDTVVSDASSPKSALKAETDPDEPLGAPDGTFRDLSNLISGASAGSTIVLDRNYVYTSGDSTSGVAIGKAITIDGAGYTIDGKDAARCLRITAGYNSNVILKNLNLVNGRAPADAGTTYGTYNYYGGAIYATGGHTLNITNCTMDNNLAGTNSRSFGGAIYMGSGTLNVRSCELYNNRAYNGGAIYHPSNPTVSFRGCAFVNNTASNLGPVAYIASGTTLAKMDFEQNWWGDNYGPGYNIYLESAEAYYARYDYYIATEILTSPITIEVNMVLDSGNTPTVSLEPRHAIVTNDADTCNTTEGWVPEPFTIEFTTSNDAYINVSIDNQYLILKVFAGENKKNITELRIVVDDVTLPAQPKAFVYSDVDGPYNITIGSHVYPVTVTDGVGTYQFENFDVGQYSAIVSRVDDPVYKTTFNTTEFEVKKYLNTLNISTETPNPTYGQDVTITHVFTPTGPTGNIIYYVDGSTTGTELDVGQNFVLSGLGAGTHTVVAKYGGDSKYGESTSNTLTITVAQASLEISVADVTVNYPNKGTVTVNANVDGKYNISVNNVKYEVTVAGGVGTFNVNEQLNPGTYEIAWNVPASVNYTGATGEAVYKVLRAEPDFSISGAAEIEYGDKNTIIPSINSDATGTIEYYIGGEKVGEGTVSQGFETAVLDVGTYTIVAKYLGDTNYENATAEFVFKVLPTDVSVTVANVEVVYPNTGTVTVTAPVSGTYTVTINGKEYEVAVGAEGTGSKEIPDVFGVGDYAIGVTATLGDNYNPVNIPNAAIYSVTKAESTIAVIYDNETKTFNVTLDGVNNEKLSATYHITIDNENQPNRQTVAGVDTFTKEGLGPGKHNIFVIFDGNQNYTGSYAQTSFDIPKKPASEVDVTITPSKDSYAYGEDVILDITVKDKETEAGLNGTVTVTIDNIDYAINITNGVGKATVKGLENGTFTATAQFLGNDEYEAASATPATVVVNASTEATITASCEPVTYGENSIIEVSVKDGAGNPIEAAKVNVTLKGDTKEYDVVDGKVDLGVLDASQYAVTVSYVDETHELASTAITVLVNPDTVDMTLTAGEGTVTIEVKDDGAPVNGTATIVIDGGNPITVPIDNTGKVTYELEGVAPGAHTVDVTFNKDNYVPSTGTVVVNVPKLESALTIATQDTPTYGDNVTITATITPGATGTITYFVDGAATGTEVAIGQNLTLTGLSAGPHTVVAKYAGDANYTNATSNTLEFTVAKADLTVTVADVTVKYPNTGTVVVKANVDGKYAIKVNGKSYDVTVTDGEGSFEVESLPADTYDIEWNIAESDNYGPSTGSANYIVEQGTPVFDITGTDKINYGQNNTIVPTITDGATGSITYSIGGETIGQTNVGESFVYGSDLNAGTYTVVAQYSGDDNYVGASAEFTFEVVPIDVDVTVANVELVYPNTGTVTVTANVPGTYTVTINGKDYEVAVADGTGSKEIPDVFGVGDYAIGVTADLGGNYNTVNIPNAATYSVTKAQSTIAVKYEDGTFTVTLVGVEDEKLSETYHVTLDNVNQEDEATVDGVDTFTKEGLGPGKHNVFVIFDGNQNYTGSYAQTSFDIPKIPASEVNVTITPSKEAYEYGENVILDVTVKAGETGLTGPVTVTIDGIDYAITVTNGVGQATVKGLSNGTFTANAQFLGNDEYEAASATPATVVVKASTKITITASSEPVTYGENSFIEVAVVDGAGNPVEVDTVNVTISGETKEYAVADGKVDLGKLDAAQYTAVVSYVDETYEPASAVATVVVNKAVSELTLTSGEGTVTIAAKDEDGNALTGTAVVVIDGGEPIEVQVAEDGTEYTLNVAPGPHTVDVTFNKENYLPDSGTVLVTVSKYAAELSIAADNTTPTFGTDVKITATITEGATGTITYYVDGATTGTEVEIGKEFVLSGLSAGEHNVTAKYGGDNNYSEATSNTVKINVAKADLVITVEDVTVTYPNKGTITVKANVDGKYTIKVENKDYEVNIVGGEGTFAVDEVLAAGTHAITWDIAATDNYNAATGSANYIVENTKPEFSISGTDEINYGQTNTITPTINSDATGTISYSINGGDAVVKDLDETFVAEGLDAGEYTVVATYSGDDNYASATAEFKFTVLPIDVEVSVDNVEVVYPNTGTVTVTASVPGTYTVTINKKDYEVTVGEDGKGSVDVTDVFGAGKYDISVSADLGDNYNPVSIGSAGTYTVTKAQSSMTVTYESGAFLVTLDGVNDEKLSEIYHVVIDNVNRADNETIDGQDTFTADDLGPGKHSVFVIFDGNDNYLGTYAQTSFDLPKMTGATVTVTTEPIKEGDEAVITITVKDGETGLSGVVTVTLDGTDYAVDVIDGEGTLKVKNLVSTESPEETSTTYPITAKFNGNDDYEEATGTGEQVVKDWNPVIIVISSAGETAVATLVDTDLNNINGKVNVTIDDLPAKEYDCIDGKVDITDITEGVHVVTVDFAGDETHPNATATATVDIGKKLIPVNLVLSLADIKYGEDATAVVSLTAKDPELGNVVRLSGKVNVTVGDQTKEVTVTDGEGQIKFSGLNANSYVAIAEFLGDDTYDYSMVTAPITVKQLKTRIVARNMTTTAINVTEDGRIGQYFSWTLVDEKGNVLANKPVSIGFNANVYNRVTNATGQARLQINLQNSGPYTFAISFLGDENYEGCFEVVKIDVNKQKAQLTSASKTYKASAATKTLTATYKTKAGNPIVGKTVKFTVNGKTYSAKTDASGVAKVNVSLNKAGTYSVEVKATETNTYAENIKTITLKLT